MSFRDNDAADFLDPIRKHIAENKAGNTSDNSVPPNYVLPMLDEFTLADAVNLNNNKHTFSDTFNLSDRRVFNRVFGTAVFVVGTDQNDEYYVIGKELKGTYKAIAAVSDLRPTTALTIAFWATLIGFTGSVRELVHCKSGSNGYDVYAKAGENKIVVEWYNGSLISSEEISFTPNTMVTVVCTFRSGNQDMYKDGVLTDSDTVSATMVASSVDVGYGGTAAGASTINASDILENLVIIDRYIDATWASRFNNGYVDLTNSGDYLPGLAGMCDCAA